MSSWLAITAGLSALKKRESGIAPLKRDIERIEQDQQEAIQKLEEATNKLVDVLAKRTVNGH